jgi:hypothetical protein
MIHLLTGFGELGGSTICHINLVNLFNENGYNACLYSPHHWHFNKCISNSLNNLKYDKNDNIIVHFLKFNNHLNVRNFIFSTHEQNLLPLKSINYHIYNKIHYVSYTQKAYHNIKYPNFVCPNVIDDLKLNENKPKEKIGGVIGSIDKNKNCIESLNKALEDGCTKVLLYGRKSDLAYYTNVILPFLNIHPNVIFMGVEEDKQKMYNSCSDIYQNSLSESYGLVKIEAEKCGLKYHGNGVVKDQLIWDKTTILNKWIKELDL